MDKGLGKRIFDFAIRTIKYCKTLPNNIEYKIIINQLIRSSTSVGSNYEEAQGAVSKPDFFNKINISLKEIRETNYWLRIIKEIKSSENEIEFLINESIELMKILGSINSKSVKRNN